jgi:hypothetical protein
MLRRTILAGLIVISPSIAGAHPPYEHQDRVITEASGRRLRLMRSYVDGIMMSDPVKLVVRDVDDRTVAETEYGRDLAVICPGPAACLVFRYDGFAPVVPANAWWFRNGELRATGSPALLALGMVLPLREHWVGYLVSLALLTAPFMVGWLIWRPQPSPVRAGILGLIALLAVPYLFFWFYGVVILSELSLPLVSVAGLGAGSMVVVVRRALRRAGVPSTAARRVARGSAFAVAGLFAVFLIVATGLFARMFAYSSGLAFDEPPVQAPLAKAMITRSRGETEEIFATVAPDVKLEDVVNLRLFDGFDPAMTRESAEARLGPPTGRWIDPIFRAEASYYDRPGGRVSLVRQGASSWTTVGHPSDCPHSYVFRDARLRDQLLQWLPPEANIQVNVLRSVGWGGLTAYIDRRKCTHLVLTARDGDPDPYAEGELPKGEKP